MIILKGGKEFDPLTCDGWWRLQPRDWDCSCGAPETAHHSDTCSVTPIYAQMIRKLGAWREDFNDLILETYDFGYSPGYLLSKMMLWPNPIFENNGELKNLEHERFDNL